MKVDCPPTQPPLSHSLYLYPLSLSISLPPSFNSASISLSQDKMEETDCGNFFDDLMDFPVDDMEAGLPPVNNQQPFPSIWSDQPPCPDSVFSNSTNSDLSAELSLPYEDIVQLEWLSTFVEDSFSGEGLTISKKSQLPEKESRRPLFNDNQISVVDSSSSSSSSCSGDIKATQGGGGGLPPVITLARYARARSKRPRPTSFNPRSNSFSLGDQTSRRDIDSNSSSNNLVISNSSSSKQKKKKKKIRFTGPVEVSEQQEMSCSEKRVRKCQHCEITKTPQWRAGPLGPKTLCNACGVRYKSGRLFPEYRPAASPTFVPCLHSNSHKKVIEMRSNNCSDLIPNTALPLHH